MSFTFQMSSNEPDRNDSVIVATLIDGLYPTLLRIEPQDDFDKQGPWPLSYLHFYVDEQSARSVEVHRSDTGFEVRILACSNRVDHELALALVRRFASALDAEIVPEDGGSVSLAAFDQQYGADWVDHQLAALPRSIVSVVEREGETVTLFGAVRPYLLGPNHLARLRAAGSEDTLAERLLADIRHVQYIPTDDLFVASVMRVGDPNGVSFTTAVIAPGVHYLLPAVDQYALMDDAAALQIPWDCLDELLPGQVERIDEQHAIVGAISDDDWPAFLKRAAAFQVDATNTRLGQEQVYTTLAEFWPYYLSEHRSPVNRALHVVGSLGGLGWLAAAAFLSNPWLVLAGVLNGYAFAWVGHFIIEKNRPATFQYPLMSFVSDWKMLYYILTFQIDDELATLDP